MNEIVQRGTYTLMIQVPVKLIVDKRILRSVLVHDFAAPRIHIKHRIETLLLELRKIQAFRKPAEFGAWEGHWETTASDWRLLLLGWDPHALGDVQRGMLYGYPVVIHGN